MRQARVSISDEPDRLKVLAKIRGLTGTQLVMRLPGRPKHPNHERAFYAKNLWCMHHTHSCSVCNAACCVLTEAVEAYDEATNHYDKAIAKEAGDVIQACVYPLDSTTFLECAECDRFVCPDCIGICPDNDCKLHFCKECKLDPWGPCSWHNLI
ncbi:MAG: hypothetical protein LQ338_006461 [Usnochroma carphineum]|nr:MAG: hypothetical protein LQ338_006461 [Usnochroma carphineum]